MNPKLNITILTGAGISRESGLVTFRDSDGLWAGYNIEEVCTPAALQRQPEKVMEFYNMRRREIIQAQPNAAHYALARLQEHHHVRIITQNIDDLHERAGSQNVHHLHGEVLKLRSMVDFDQVVKREDDVQWGELAPDGHPLRPHVCFFDETPYDWDQTVEWVEQSDLFAVIGTSLRVYPAALLLPMASGRPRVIIDPEPRQIDSSVEVIALPATEGVPLWVNRLLPSPVSGD